ncbi:hypothetical protein N9B82_03360, partial [Saprospiraceae bacterium]|nr:hypothetical protein [Saprospiraceae bacterium]
MTPRKIDMQKAKLETLISPGIGLGDLKFGMFRNEVEELLGVPTEIEKISYIEGDEDSEYVHWHYATDNFFLTFEKEDNWRFGTITIESEAFQLFDMNPIGTHIEVFKDKIMEWEVYDFELEDMSSIESPKHILVSSDTLGINFWFDDDHLVEMQISPLFESEEILI